MLPKKFYFSLLIIITISSLLLFKEVRRGLSIVTKQKNEPLVAYELTPLPLDSSELVFGNPGAPITVIEFSNLACEKCAILHASLTSFVSKHPQEMRLIWKYAPNAGWFSDNFEEAHKGVYCAGKQNKQWEFLEAAKGGKNNLDEPRLSQMAGSLRLNMNAWKQCLNSEEAKQKIMESGAIAEAFNIRAPAVFVNNRKIYLDKNIDIEEMMGRVIEK